MSAASKTRASSRDCRETVAKSGESLQSNAGVIPAERRQSAGATPVNGPPLCDQAAPPNDGYTGSSDSQDTQDSQGHPRSSPSASGSLDRDKWDPPWEWEFEPFVKWAAEFDNAYEEGHYSPNQGWRSQLWSFTRHIKSWLKEGTTADDAFKSVDRVIRKNGGWENVFDWIEPFSDEDAYTEFVTTWPKIRHRLHEGPLEQALAKAKVCPVKAPKRDGLPPAPKYDLFIGLCGFLQFTRGNIVPGHKDEAEAFYLPCHKVAKLLDTTPRMVSIWRQWAIAAGFLQVVKEHSFRSKGKSEATEFVVADVYRPQFEKFYKTKVG